MPIGKVWIYRLLIVSLCVCTVTDFSGEDKASGVKFCTEVHRRPGQAISLFGEICSQESQNRTNRRAASGRRITFIASVSLISFDHQTGMQQIHITWFLANVNLCLGSLYVIAIPSVVCLSSVCDVGGTNVTDRRQTDDRRYAIADIK